MTDIPSEFASAAAPSGEIPATVDPRSPVSNGDIVNQAFEAKRWAAIAPLPERALHGRRPLFRS